MKSVLIVDDNLETLSHCSWRVHAGVGEALEKFPAGRQPRGRSGPDPAEFWAVETAG